MTRLLAGCIWLIAVTTGSAYVSAVWNTRGAGHATPVTALAGLERKKIAPVNVPIIVNGNVEGYVVTQLVYLADARTLQEVSVPPDDFMADETFRALYSSDVDFNHLEKFDLKGLTKDLTQTVNQRLGREIIKDVLVAEFNYVPKNEISK